MRRHLYLILLFLCGYTMIGLQCTAQTEPSNIFRDKGPAIVGGAFENRDFMFTDMPEQLMPVDTSPGWEEPGPKILIQGRVFHRDGVTPAPNVILYYYHTDIHGIYADKTGLNPRIRRHGYIRGWIKTDREGHYGIYTIRPASYPNTSIQAHIHVSVKEPDISIPYWIDEWVFDDDPLLAANYEKNMRKRGGSGILNLVQQGDLWVANHNVILGLNIPNYPD